MIKSRYGFSMTLIIERISVLWIYNIDIVEDSPGNSCYLQCAARHSGYDGLLESN